MGGGGHSAPGGRSLGRYLAKRLTEIGVSDYLTVPGDFTLALLDELGGEEGLHMVGCCNELNAGYAADGYARGKGVGCVVVTHLVGGLSVLNAIAGAYAEHSAVVCVVGIPNSNDLDGPRLLHHTLADTDTTNQTAAYRPFTCHQERIKSIDRAAEQVDAALGQALRQRRPVLIEIAANLARLTHPSLAPTPVPYALQPLASNPRSLEAAVAAVADVLNKAESPAFIGGPLLKPYAGQETFLRLVEAAGCPAAVQASAKGMFPEDHPQYLGVYWGVVSSPQVVGLLKSADVLLAAGALVNDMNTVGFTGPLSDDTVIQVGASRVTLGGGVTFGCVQMVDFLEALPAALERKWGQEPSPVPKQPSADAKDSSQPTFDFDDQEHAAKRFKASRSAATTTTNGSGASSCTNLSSATAKMDIANGSSGELEAIDGSSSDSKVAAEALEQAVNEAKAKQEVADSAPYFRFAPADNPHAPITANALYYHIQAMLKGNHVLVTDCGDSLFQTMKLRLPSGMAMEMQAQYASIGWSVGATLGLAAAFRHGGRRVLGVIGDGAFQMTAQEVATIMRQRLNPIIVLLNNSSYAIEEMVHAGPYNELKAWDYAGLAEALSNGDGTTFAARVKTEADLVAALEAANGAAADKFCLLDITLAPSDCSAELLKFGAALGAFGSRPPMPR